MLDDVLDADRLLPGASLKGVMREAARLVRPRVAADVDDARGRGLRNPSASLTVALGRCRVPVCP